MKCKLYNLCFFFVMLSSFLLHAQERTITGTVSDESGPLPGVSIIIKGTTNGTETDFDGKYSINTNTGDVLVFSFVGMATQEKTVGVANTIDVVLQADNLLSEVVVVAYGTSSKKKLITSVSKIDNAAIKDLVTDSPQNILQGQAAGVQVVGSSGILGAAPEVRIRGTSSIGSNSRPLYVIDGVVLSDVDQTFNQGGAQGLNPLASINPNNIADISVLKSSAAAALYGSRGANGVVLITTKSGSRDGKAVVSLNINTSFSQVTDTPDLLNAQQYISFQNDFRGIGTADRGADFDFLDAVLNDAVSTSYNLSVSGGNDKTNYFISATREDQEGIVIGNSLERTSFRTNISTKAKDWLTAGMNLAVNLNRNDRTPISNAFASPYTIANLQRPDIAPIDDQGNFTTAGNTGGGNVIAQETFNINLATITRITGNSFLDFDLSSLVGGLSFKQDFGVDRVLTENQSRNIDLLTPGGSAGNSVFQQNRFTATSTFSYDKSFGQKHNISVLAGYSYDQLDIRNIQVSGTGFLSDSFLNVASANTFPITTAGATTSRLVSYFGRAVYDFDDGRYVLEGSVRRDGSSRFGINNQFGTFWSAAAGWNISDESFMENVDWIQNVKLNAGVGTSGNDRIGNFASLGTFANANFNGASGLRQSTLANPDLRWESTTSFDVGLNASFFNRRLSIGVEYYERVTDDLILFVPVDPTFNVGLNGRNENIGEIENRGFDVTLNSSNINTDDFKWTSSLNLGFNTSEVTSLPADNIDERGNRFVTIGGFSGQRAILGESVNSFYLIRFSGINSQTGDAEWLDADGNLTSNPQQSDRVVAGKANPDLVGGFTNVFTYKNWTLNTLFNFSFGNDIYLATRRFSENPNSGFQKTTRVLNFWEQPGDNAFIPAATSSTFGTLTQDSTRFLEDGSFVRLKNVTLSYSLPQKFLESSFINSVRLYGTATNLVTFKSDDLDGIDPEVSRGASGANAIGEDFFNLPQARTITLGLNVTF